MRSTIARRPWIGALLLTFVATIASAQMTRQKADTSGAEQQVRAAQDQLLQAAIKGDKDDVSKFLADDVSWVGRDGQVMGKEQMLASLPAPVHTVDVQQVQTVGNAAVVVALVHMKDGTERRALQEWINQNGQWKVMAHQSSPVNATPSPTAGASPTGTSGGKSAPEARTVEPTLNSDAERAVWRAQTEMIEAYDKGDTNAYAKLTATPFTRIETNGQLYNRRQWLDRVSRNAKQPLKKAAVSDVKIDVNNDVARATMQIVPFNADGTQGSPERQTRIFALRNAQWQQVAAISTPIGQQ